jgi:aminoglycoside 2'-N-acetyltransferase I
MSLTLGGVTRSEPILRRVPTGELTETETAALRELLWTTFGPDEEAFSEDDWQHALGGVHFLLERGGEIVAHASVVERELHAGGQPLRTGYVEAVATHPRLQGSGLGTRVMAEAGAFIRERFELGALATGNPGFYQRLGWLTWVGPTFVRNEAGDQRTPMEDGAILVLPTPTSPRLELSAPISCEWRPGDVW